MHSATTRPRVSVIIPTRNRADKLARCLDSVYKSDCGEIEVVVVDDASEAPVSAIFSGKFPNIRFVRNSRRELLSCSRNSGAAVSSGDYLFFLDDDNVLAPDTIRLLAETLDKSERVAVSSPIIFYLSRPTTVWTSYISRGKFPGFYALHTDVPRANALTFSFHNSFMVKKSIFDLLHGFDCVNFPIRFSEVDFAHRLSARGYVALVNPSAKDWHDLGWTMVHVDSARAYYTERNRIIVIKKYFKKRDLSFYSVCILPFVGTYYLVHHPLSTTDGRMKTASSFLRGIVAGLTFNEPNNDKSGGQGGKPKGRARGI
jgi:GT2 family glycosyltransferase